MGREGKGRKGRGRQGGRGLGGRGGERKGREGRAPQYFIAPQFQFSRNMPEVNITQTIPSHRPRNSREPCH